MTELTSDLLKAARHGKRNAVVTLLATYYPVVWRMAVGLTGRGDVGRGVTRFMMQRSLRAMGSWNDESAPSRWFHHHTLLTTRRTLKHTPGTANDTLLGNGTPPDAPYLAFIRALRSLPMQQREAFILSCGEKLDVRAIAVAMDCSVLAAGNHLREASDRLRALAPEGFDSQVKRMCDAYRKLSPDEEMAIKDIRRRVQRHFFPSAVAGWIIRIAILTIFIATLWAGYWAWTIIQSSIQP